MANVTLNIKGMTCGGCVRSVTAALQGKAGVETVEVLLDQGLAHIAYDPAQTTPQQLAEVLDDIGFEAAVM